MRHAKAGHNSIASARIVSLHRDDQKSSRFRCAPASRSRKCPVEPKIKWRHLRGFRSWTASPKSGLRRDDALAESTVEAVSRSLWSHRLKSPIQSVGGSDHKCIGPARVEADRYGTNRPKRQAAQSLSRRGRVSISGCRLPNPRSSIRSNTTRTSCRCICFAAPNSAGK